MSETRKLVAILVADVVEYDRLGQCRPAEKYVEHRFQGDNHGYAHSSLVRRVPGRGGVLRNFAYCSR
jgi:hypothetical protein